MKASTSLLDMNLTEIAKWLLRAILIFCLVLEFMVLDLGLPSGIRFVADITMIIVTVFVLLDRKNISVQREANLRSYTGKAIGLFVIWASLSALFNFVPTSLYIWAMRNTGRFLLYFCFCALVFTLDDWKKLMRTLSIFVVINTLFIVYQFVVLGVRQDYLNGFLGTYVGGNSALNTLYIVVTAWLISSFLSNEMKLVNIILPVGSMIIASALNELKFYYVELIIILLVCALTSSTSRNDVLKGMGVALGAAIAFLLGTQLLSLFYPGFRDFFTFETLQEYLFSRSYNSSEQLFVSGVPVMNRLSSIIIIPKYFFDSLGNYIMGIGFGATETSSISIFTSSFSLMYGDTNYQGYSSAYLLLELGYVGVLLYFGIFLSVMYYSVKQIKKLNDDSSSAIYSFGIAIAFLAIVLCFYNSALRIETSGYLLFAALAVPFMFGNASPRRHGC
ncbi:hypothetical protein [Collinsella ihumii]|uniref:hypothetical protein n=1 Tax=Collinsella ihumii TaxID=1720204 RepID=UPI0025AAA020|nr:hypothetical protein [Collinsella ihumii]MDN0055207.1 hypothetical protein [Collinsella ihumii]